MTGAECEPVLRELGTVLQCSLCHCLVMPPLCIAPMCICPTVSLVYNEHILLLPRVTGAILGFYRYYLG